MRVIANRLLAGNYYSLVSRFTIARKLYSACLATHQAYFKKPSYSYMEDASITFHNQDTHGFVSKIRRDGFVMDLSLPSELIEEIFQYASAALCHCNYLDRNFFKHEIKNGKLPSGETVLNAAVNDPDRCDAVSVVVGDPFLRRVAASYLGYAPRRTKSELRWTFCSSIPAEAQWERAHLLQREKETPGRSAARWKQLARRLRYHLTEDPPYSAVYYHFDTFGYNSVRAYFYITNVDRCSGAHVVIKGSHCRKSPRMLLSPGIFPESQLLSYYGRENEVVIEGQAGTGFMEDVACYHKVLPPTKTDRLMLIITYS